MATSTLSKVQEWLAGVLNSEDPLTMPSINERSSLSIAAVWYAVNRIAGDFGQIPLLPWMQVGEQRRQFSEHPSWYLLKYQPNEYQTACTFKEMLTAHLLLWGNGRAYIRRVAGRPVELIPMRPDATKTYLVEGEKFHAYKAERDERFSLIEDMQRDPDNVIVLPDSDVLHIMGLTIDGIEGVSVISNARRNLLISAAADVRAANQMKKGFTGRVFFEAPVGAYRDDKDALDFIESVRKKFKADSDSEIVGLLREGVKANVLNMSNEDMQFLQSRAFQREEIMLWFGLESMPGVKDSVSYNSLEMKERTYYRSSLSKIAERWVQACNIRLLERRELESGTAYFRVILDSLLRSTTLERYQASAIAREIGVLSANEVRKLEDMNPREGGDRYDNPRITPGDQSSEPPQNIASAPLLSAEEPAKLPRPDAKAMRVMFGKLISVEANKAIHAARSRNFVAWMEKFYAKWEQKIADDIEAVGGDRDLATMHCNESKRRLLEAAECQPEELVDRITQCVANWEERAQVIIEEMELRHVC